MGVAQACHPIVIIYDPPNLYIISKQYASCGVLPGIGLSHFWLSATDEIQKDRNRGLAWTSRLRASKQKKDY